MTTELPAVVAEHIAAVNAFDTDRIVATFAPDAYVNDNRREVWGADSRSMLRRAKRSKGRCTPWYGLHLGRRSSRGKTSRSGNVARA